MRRVNQSETKDACPLVPLGRLHLLRTSRRIIRYYFRGRGPSFDTNSVPWMLHLGTGGIFARPFSGTLPRWSTPRRAPPSPGLSSSHSEIYKTFQWISFSSICALLGLGAKARRYKWNDQIKNDVGEEQCKKIVNVRRIVYRPSNLCAQMRKR